MNIAGLRRKTLLLFIFAAVLPVLISVLISICELVLLGPDSPAAALLIVDAFVSLLLFSAEITFTLMFVNRLGGFFSRVEKGLSELLTEEERESLRKSSAGRFPAETLALLDYLAVQKENSMNYRRDTSLAMAALRHTTLIVFKKTAGAEDYTLFIPEIWRKRYPNLPLSGRCNLLEFLDDTSAAELKTVFAAAEKKERRLIRQRARVKISDSRSACVMVTAYSERQRDSGGFLQVCGTIYDVNAREKLESVASEYHGMYDFALESSDDIIFEVNLQDDYVTIATPELWSRALEFMYAAGSYSNQRGKFIEMIHPDYREGFIERFYNYDHVVDEPDMRHTYEYRIRTRDRDTVWMEQTIKVVSHENGHACRVVGRLRNVSERKRRELVLSDGGQRDSLTATLAFSEVRERFIAANAKESGASLALILINLPDVRGMLAKYGGETVELALSHVADACRFCGGVHFAVGRDRKDEGGEFVAFINTPDSAKAAGDFARGIDEIYKTPVSLGKYTIELHPRVLIESGGGFDQLYTRLKRKLTI